ncbi:hypothetical protein LQW54_005273 [Pestalotiopsis sp. IQ-011]
MGPKEARQYRQNIVMNTEDDMHFPTMKVSETIDFVAGTKLPKGTPDGEHPQVYKTQLTESTLDALGIGHTKDTIVGDEFIRGVSGGERKRVSLAEVLATQAPLQCWDNSTRGLDASNALDFARVLRKGADENQRTIIATLYQAGNGIFKQFDKVLVLAEGREIYYGPAGEAKSYFENMGFVCAPGANVADFLTSVAVHTERRVAPGHENSVPSSAADFEDAYKRSLLYSRMLAEIAAKKDDALSQEVANLKAARDGEKNRSLPFLSREGSPYQVSFAKQVIQCTVRQFRIIWGDRWSNCLKIGSALIMSLVTGSLFYDLSNDSDSVFMRFGALFFPLLFFCLNSMSETVASFKGRPIISRHKRLGFARPAAHMVACAITDIPLVVTTLSLFEIIFYFMVDFQMSGSKFFTQWFIYLVTILSFTSFFRMIGAWSIHFGIASQISGWCTMVMMIYAGYLIPVPQMHVWFRWISWINPATYAFEAAVASDLADRIMGCVEPQYVPYGAAYADSSFRGCTTAGTETGSSRIDGAALLSSEYSIYTSHIWRNVGINIGFWIFFAALASLGAEVRTHADAGSKIRFDRRSRNKETEMLKDSEKQASSASASGGAPEVSIDKTVFTFKNINYFVHHMGSEKQLLQDVSGFVKPGQLVALMGSSGAGKTTLMDVLAQRKDSGRIEGSIMVNGQPQGISFQRMTGYCEQNDVHEATATVREALIFSARLRQKHEIPDIEKVEYVERIMDLLELTPLQHALVGTPGSGLSIEQRKRLTIATELVAKPSLLFLDEPTSGLDGQSAFNICRFMQKLAASGQTIIATIHQPSAALFNAFDVLLLLAKGGRTTYFGPIGEDSSTVVNYFAQRGIPCPLDANPAEHVVDVVQGRFGTETDWPQLWLDSEEKKESLAELEEMNRQEQAQTNKTPTAASEEDERDFAAPLAYQIQLVTKRQMVALWRNPDYVWNKMGLHISNALFGGFTFWMIGDGSFDLQLRLMAVFNFVFVAPGCINQLQPMFIANRDLFETREKKAKTYTWLAFVTAQLVSEIPVLIVCGTLYFACWYFTVGFPVKASASGQVYLQMILYEFLYTSIGQAIAAYSPNDFFAALANPIIIGAALVNFCGVVVPYSYIQPFWRYWLYYLDPFNYLIGGLLEPVVWDVVVQCKDSELTTIPLPSNATCGEYMADFLSTEAGYVVDSSSTSSCQYCPYSSGADYLRTLNINERYYGWRDVGITALFCISSYVLVFLMMKLRTKATKTAS